MTLMFLPPGIPCNGRYYFNCLRAHTGLKAFPILPIFFSSVLNFLYFYNLGHFFFYFFTFLGKSFFSGMNLSKRCCLSAVRAVSVRFTYSPVTFPVKYATGKQIKAHERLWKVFILHCKNSSYIFII